MTTKPDLIHSDILAILNLLEIEDDIIEELRQRVNAMDRVENAQALIAELKEQINSATRLRKLEDTPYYYILLACCYLPLNKLQEAIHAAQQAIGKARLCDLDWLEAMAHWLLSLIYRENDNIYMYRVELNEARELTQRILNEHQKKGQYQKVDYCATIVKKIEEEHAYATKDAKENIGISTPADNPSSQRQKRQPGDYLTATWLPVYNGVRAGLSGVSWIEQIGYSIGISQIVIEDRYFNLFNLRKTSSTDRQIRIRPGERAGFIKVIGNSMNACTPTSIEENDYILFYKTQNAADGDIVIASQPSPSGDPAYIVKRYKATDKTLLSETNDTTQAYPPIKIGRQHQILGIVIAVAKPTRDKPL